MSYSIKAATKGYANKEGLTKVFILVIYQRMKVYVPTVIKAPVNDKGELIKHRFQKKYDAIISEQKIEIESRLLDALRRNKNLSKKQFEEAVKGKIADTSTITKYIELMQQENKTRLSRSTIAHYSVLADKIERFEPGARLSDISIRWLQRFETWLRSRPGREPDSVMDGNTVKSKMTKMKAICNYAREAGLIEEKQYRDYKVPKYVQKIPVYLTESELDKIKVFCDTIDKPSHKLAGYYFLLSSFTGYRISDSKRFNYDDMVVGNKIILRAKKNKNIVSIPLYPKLKEIIDFVKDHPFSLSEQKVRQYVKDICSFVGIHKHVKFHSSRHTFAVLMLSKGLTIDEVSSLLGDSNEVAKIYARINNQHLERRFNEIFG